MPVADAGDTPTGDRPRLPPAYGVPTDAHDLLPWAHVQRRMSGAVVYWVAVASREGRPHATPVDGVWLDDALFISGDPSTRRHRYLAENPAVSVHLESGTDVVILNGTAQRVDVDEATAQRLAAASREKYGYGEPGLYLANDVYALRPAEVLAWSRFPHDLTRWRLDPA